MDTTKLTPGDKVRLVRNHGDMDAAYGATATFRGFFTDEWRRTYLTIEWNRSDGLAADQMDGNYDPDNFEIVETKSKRRLTEGDKVIYVGDEGFLKNQVGTITIDDRSGVPYVVTFENMPEYRVAFEWWCLENEVIPFDEDPEPSQLSFQFGGDHYKKQAIQPIEYIMANGLGYCEGNVVKYITRYPDKGGVEDLKKARHYIDFLIEKEESKDV